MLDLNCHQQEHQKQQLKRLGGMNSHDYSFFGSYVESLVLLDKGEEHTVGYESQLRLALSFYSLDYLILQGTMSCDGYDDDGDSENGDGDDIIPRPLAVKVDDTSLVLWFDSHLCLFSLNCVLALNAFFFEPRS
ncbi:hypothetical protein DM860_012074 [Cuscuta australis]|uniref:Uncharacterized protein n=1 Tax=Cuscuta australis TaxID=267555 RepID=A0A328DDH7_9ASTE|nr:hypothetical protein DM860_012074 [Cuscuta australis]